MKLFNSTIDVLDRYNLPKKHYFFMDSDQAKNYLKSFGFDVDSMKNGISAPVQKENNWNLNFISFRGYEFIFIDPNSISEILNPCQDINKNSAP